MYKLRLFSHAKSLQSRNGTSIDELLDSLAGPDELPRQTAE